MNCPRCHGALDERERDGVIVDVCHDCRGIWLDRGELEKLIARASREFNETAPRRDDTPSHGASHRSGVTYRSEDTNRSEGTNRREPPKKRRWFESLSDLFD